MKSSVQKMSLKEKSLNNFCTDYFLLGFGSRVCIMITVRQLIWIWNTRIILFYWELTRMFFVSLLLGHFLRSDHYSQLMFSVYTNTTVFTKATTDLRMFSLVYVAKYSAEVYFLSSNPVTVGVTDWELSSINHK